MRAKRGFTAVIGLIGLLLTFSCGGTNLPLGQGPPGTTTPEVLYAATSSAITALVVDTTTGGLTTVSGSPFAVAQPASLALDPGGKFLYVASATLGVSNLLTFSIDTASGALTLATSATFPSVPGFIAVDASAKNAYVVTNTTSSQRLIGAYGIDATTHALTLLPNFPIAVAVTPQALVLDPAGRFAYVLGQGEVDVFARDSVTGSIAPVAGSPFAFTAAHTFGLGVVPAGDFLLAPLFDVDEVAVLSVSSTGVLTEATGSPVAAGAAPFAVTVDPSGKFVYVANRGTPPAVGTVSAFSINASGLLTPVGTPVNAGLQPGAITADPTGKFVFVANAGSNTITGYTINATSGALTELSGTPTVIPSGVVALAVLPSK